MSLKISRVLHAGYLFEAHSTVILFDPIFETPFSRNCHPYPAVEFDLDRIRTLRFDAIFISHYHDDHCSFESLDRLDRTTPIYLYCVHPEMFALIEKLGFKDVHSLELNVSVTVGAIEVTPRRALDADVDSIFHVRAGGVNVLNVVDSWIDDYTLGILAKSAPWDLVLWPFQTMRELEVIAPAWASSDPVEIPNEWAQQLKVLNPRYLVPSSCQFIHEPWSWYARAFFPISYARFAREMSGALPSAEIVRLNPGCAIELSPRELRRAEPLPWIKPVGDQEVDYAFDPNAAVPSTAEIAPHLGRLDSEELARVDDYCRNTLPRRYQELDHGEREYFAQPRVWRLVVYDHEGDSAQYTYRVERGRLELTAADAHPIAWSTEIAAVKLLAAVEEGESLSSLYLRINDLNFTPSVAIALGTADMMEDPLMRCLYSGFFGAYQMAQLKRLRLE